MNNKKLYVWQLADFLSHHSMRMSGEGLADHLNRNNFLTPAGASMQGRLRVLAYLCFVSILV